MLISRKILTLAHKKKVQIHSQLRHFTVDECNLMQLQIIVQQNFRLVTFK